MGRTLLNICVFRKFSHKFMRSLRLKIISIRLTILKLSLTNSTSPSCLNY